jgi:hypothetical protein
MMARGFLSKVFQSNPINLRAQSALERHSDDRLLSIVQSIYAGREQARAAMENDPQAKAMIAAIQAYKARLITSCRFGNTPQPRAEDQDQARLIKTEISIVRHARDKNLSAAFDTMITSGQAYLKSQSDPNTWSRPTLG